MNKMANLDSPVNGALYSISINFSKKESTPLLEWESVGDVKGKRYDLDELNNYFDFLKQEYELIDQKIKGKNLFTKFYNKDKLIPGEAGKKYVHLKIVPEMHK